MRNDEQNKKKKRKILLSLLLILFIGVVLTASTYTWFTANRIVSVDELDVNVSTSTGLQISVDAKNWKTTVTKDDINNAATTYETSTNQVPAQSIEPMSTAAEVDARTGFIKMFRGMLASQEESDTLMLTAEQETETRGNTGNFIAFDLFFQVNQETPIYLTSGSTVVNGDRNTAIQNAARVAFVPQGHADPGSDPNAVIQPLKASDNTGVKIWEPNNDVHTAAAVQNALSTYQITTQQTGATPLSYYEVKKDIAAPGVAANAQDADKFAQMDSFIIGSPQAGIPTTQYLNLITLQPGVTKVRVYMWVEGQDVDCENNASGGDLLFNLEFSSMENATDSD